MAIWLLIGLIGFLWGMMLSPGSAFVFGFIAFVSVGIVYLIGFLVYSIIISQSPESPSIKFLKPTPSKIIIFAFFMVIVAGGSVQTWAFSGKDMGTPKPFLYDILKPLPFWVLWMYLSLPLFVVSVPFSIVASGPLFLPLNMIYFYTLASLMVSSYERYGSTFTKKFWAILIGLALGFNVLNTIWAIISGITVRMGLSEIILMGMVSGTMIIVFYGYLFICIVLSVLDLWRSRQ